MRGMRLFRTDIDSRLGDCLTLCVYVAYDVMAHTLYI